ncbi:site-specific integrase [Actinomyces urogenitalis]|uniref:Site-specific integrase n=1 Tax=Actinomyces urogenitalis TaxID=103621 RepID=A0A2I1KVY6_9ACTO|nr:site-specific integrase [Actinomyces urogenitalis]
MARPVQAQARRAAHLRDVRRLRLRPALRRPRRQDRRRGRPQGQGRLRRRGASVPTLAKAANAHLDALTASATPGTIRKYRQILRDRIIPTFGPLPVDTITRTSVEQWIGNLRATPVGRGAAKKPPSAKTLRNAQALLSAILQRQVDEGVLARNVAKGVPLPRDTVSRPMVFLRAAQVEAIIKAAPPHYRPLIAALYGLGLRFGEATALTVADLDLDADVPSVRVTKAWKEGDGAPYVGAPKTRRGVRTVSVPDPLVPVLRAQAEGKSGKGLLFTTLSGGPVRSGPFHTRCWQPAVKAAGLDPRPRVHDLRHSHASALIAAGIPLPVIQRRLGHESIQTTVDTYGHLAPDAAVAAAAAIAATMGQAAQIEG